MNIKKIVCAALVVVACVSAASAQSRSRIPANALGLRFTGGWLFGAEVNYQTPKWALFGSDRFELGVGWGGGEWDEVDGGVRYDREEHWIGATGVTQWHWNISPTAAKGGFNWYAGPGAGVGFTFRSARARDGNPQRAPRGWREDSMYLGIGGQIGIEYDFNALGAPLNISIDTRPMIDLINMGGLTIGGVLNGATLALRFTF